MTLLGAGKPPSVSVATTTLDPVNKGTTVTLSNGDLTATSASAGAYDEVRSVASYSSGKFYYEVTYSTLVTTLPVVGICNSSAPLNGAFLGSDLNAITWFKGGSVFINNSAVTTLQTWAQGDVLAVAVDFTAQKIWFRSNASTNWNNDVIGNQNPATGTGGVAFNASGSPLNAGPYFAAAQEHDAGDVLTVNFGATSYTLTPPAGFGNW